MTEEEIKLHALSIHIASSEFDKLSVEEKKKVFSFYAENQSLIEDAQFMIRNGVGGGFGIHSERAEAVLRSGVIPSCVSIYKPPERPQPVVKPKKMGYVYLMKNHRNGYIKIGWSVRPRSREATFQSEEPEVTLIYKSEGTMDDERALHKMFDSDRVRGEWFALSASQIEEVEMYFGPAF